VSHEIEPTPAQPAYWNGPTADRRAASWQLLERADAESTAAVLRLAAPRAGERVLDIGCGAGATTLLLREHVVPGGAVTGIDVSAPILAVARERAAGTGVTFVEADASSHAFRPELDLLFSQFGVMFFAEPRLAFANLLRAAAAGGRLAFICWRPPADNAWVTAPLGAARELLPGIEPPPVGAPGPFGLADRDHVHGVLERAGWREIQIERDDHARLFGETVEEAAQTALAIGVLPRFTAHLDADSRDRLRDRLRDALAPFHGPSGVLLPASTWLVSAHA